ncbi:DUF4199 domain-containing protein [Pontibacter sp. KCTC 32443]|uniref:DUF4199 domain-containing protein n=1 Tax=Pontibacter TaxID=323449 RepID=UPI00164E5B6B|nr:MULTISPECIES: DUF4199 domain-containing protein [Pontibacter]MBC5772434.1 DUF4199 domain-containing protein [Pontibacter sp. KCTC 32443]
MFNQAIIRVGIRYGVTGGVVCFAIVLLLYFLGLNPFGDYGRYSFIPIPFAIFMGIRYYKKFNDTEIGFLRGLRVGASITFYTALCASMLVFILTYIAGPELLQQHIEEMKMMLETGREEQVKLFGEKWYQEAYKAAVTTTPSSLAAGDFIRRFLGGMVFALVAAVYFRK